MHYTLEEIKVLHKKYAPCNEVYNLVFTHCQIVCDIAEQLAAKGQLKVDLKLVRIGSLLHDIGVHPLFGVDGKLKPGVNYITHGAEGETILRNEGSKACRCQSQITRRKLTRSYSLCMPTSSIPKPHPRTSTALNGTNKTLLGLVLIRQ